MLSVFVGRHGLVCFIGIVQRYLFGFTGLEEALHRQQSAALIKKAIDQLSPRQKKIYEPLFSNSYGFAIINRNAPVKNGCLRRCPYFSSDSPDENAFLSLSTMTSCCSAGINPRPTWRPAPLLIKKLPAGHKSFLKTVDTI